MTHREYAALGGQMRQAQKAYSRLHRDDPKKGEALTLSKSLERQFDAETRAVLHPPEPTLFDNQPEGDHQ